MVRACVNGKLLQAALAEAGRFPEFLVLQAPGECPNRIGQRLKGSAAGLEDGWVFSVSARRCSEVPALGNTVDVREKPSLEKGRFSGPAQTVQDEQGQPARQQSFRTGLDFHSPAHEQCRIGTRVFGKSLVRARWP